MENDFKIYQEGEKQIIERLIFPRFKGTITFDNDLSNIEEIDVIDDCINVIELSKALREAGEYIVNNSKK